MPNISRGRVAFNWHATRDERKKWAPRQQALMRPDHGNTEARPFSASEDNEIRRSYRVVGSKILGERMGRNYRSIQTRARYLGVAECRA